ncbi:conjugal transfer protein [Streptomyces hydrogenans]
MGLGPTARRVIGLPDPEDWQKKRAKRERKKSSGASGAVPPPGMANPWETAARQLTQQQPTPAPTTSTPPPAGEPTTPWVTLDERSGSAFARRFGRGVLWTLIGGLALIGAKSVFLPKKPPAPAAPSTPAQAAPAYPTDEAQAVAGRFARSYLGWDEAAPDVRAAGLAAVLPDGTDTAMGWDGKGSQDVLAVQTGAVTPGARKQARVRVDVLVRPAAPAAPAKPAPARWVGLDVPVIQAGGRVVVVGAPGLVGVPATGPKLPELIAPESDGEFAEQTTETITKFFTAYAAGDTETIAAPGASIPALPDGVTLIGEPSWTADKGTGSDRTGTALVTWQIGGAQLEQSYRVQLTRVVSADAQRWQVAAVSGGTV